MIRLLLSLFLLTFPLVSLAEPGIPAVTVTDGEGGQSYSVTLQILALMTLLTLLPAALMMMTSFTRIIILFSFFRPSFLFPSPPPFHFLIRLSFFLSLFFFFSFSLPPP